MLATAAVVVVVEVVVAVGAEKKADNSWGR